ncbi:MAG: SAM-dependent methyltransferase [Parvibaculaceae bacterium]
MATTSGNPSLIAMRGAGYYSTNTAGAKTVIDSTTTLVLDAIAGMDLTAPKPFAIADFGAADGGTSIDLMRQAVSAIRDRSAEKKITITYTDLPSNDFSSLFSLLQGDGGLGREKNLFAFASGTTFYRQIFPDGSLDLGYSATAMHWLSRKPAAITDQVHSSCARPHEKSAFRDQSLADWETILLARARELAPGGVLVFANFTEDENGHYLGWTGGVNMHANFARNWRKLFEEGRISQAEFHAAAFQQHYKTPAEFAAPFRDPDSPVAKAGLTLETMFTRATPCPYAAEFKRRGDKAAFARSYIPTLRSWSESTFMSALDKARPLSDRKTIVDSFYAGYEADVASDPAGHAMDYVHCFMVIRKAPHSG